MSFHSKQNSSASPASASRAGTAAAVEMEPAVAPAFDRISVKVTGSLPPEPQGGAFGLKLPVRDPEPDRTGEKHQQPVSGPMRPVDQSGLHLLADADAGDRERLLPARRFEFQVAEFHRLCHSFKCLCHTEKRFPVV